MLIESTYILLLHHVSYIFSKFIYLFTFLLFLSFISSLIISSERMFTLFVANIKALIKHFKPLPTSSSLELFSSTS